MYDIVCEIINCGLWGVDLTLQNFKKKLTFSQVKFLNSKIQNLNKKKMESFYIPLVFAISRSFSSEENKKSDFMQFIYDLNDPEDKRQQRFRTMRKSFFKEKHNDFNWIIDHCQKKGLSLSAYFDEEQLKDLLNKKKQNPLL